MNSLNPTPWMPATRHRTWTAPAIDDRARTFHQSLSGYEPTPLISLPQLARELGVGQVVAKVESSRLGLPAFKALGASWAVHQVLTQQTNERIHTLVTATDGNHGRAVAHFARLFGHQALIVLPEGVNDLAAAAIEAEGAEVQVVQGNYDDAVAAAASAAHARPDRILVQDTAWEGYTEVPEAIVQGYATLFAELDEQLQGADAPDLVLVPSGVGSLLQAALMHYRAAEADGTTGVVAVEPTVAACLPPSLEAGAPTTVPTGHTIMAGLNCGTPSAVAWPLIAKGMDGTAAVTDQEAIRAGHDLAAHGVDAGPCGAASLAAARVIAASSARTSHLNLGPQSVVALLITEGTASNPLPSLPA